MNEPIAPFELSPAEWLTLFPNKAEPVLVSGQQLPYSLLPTRSDDNVEAGVASLDDSAAELRKQYPVNRNVLDATLEKLGARGLAVQTRLMATFLSLTHGLPFLINWTLMSTLQFAINSLIWR
jgi:hypothetical protein